MNERRKARGLALQALYELDCTTHPLEVVITTRLAEMQLSPDNESFMRAIVSGVAQCGPDLDLLIERYAPEWPLAQMAIVDKTILRMAIWEFAIGRTTPLKVAINEAVELAKNFGSEAAGGFVNGVLGSLVNKEDDLMNALSAKH
jgi:N utilization substance protein B